VKRHRQWDAVLVWVLLFGVWPAFNPPHDGSSVTSVVDLICHFVAAGWLSYRWEIVRRTPDHTNRR